MNDYKPQLKTLLNDLKGRPHCILESKATELQAIIESYIAGDMTCPDPCDPEDDTMDDVEVITTNGIAVVEINGIICKRLGLPEEILDMCGLVDLDNVDTQLKALMGDDTITAVVLNITSPGGFITGVESTAALIGKLTTKKECVVYSDVLNASAAYWLSSQASSIIVSRDATVGSIGVYTQVFDYSKYLDMNGIKVNLIKAGKWKALGDPTQPLSDESKAFMQSEVDATWALFKAAVNTNRTVAEEDMQGQCFNGAALLTKGLVDGYADSITDVIDALSNT